MKKALTFLFAVAVCNPVQVARGAVAVKKASPVATQSSGGTGGAASLVPTVLNLVSNVQQLNAKQKELTQECIPSAAEITFVDNTMKEWAKTGAMSAEEIKRQLRRSPCPGGSGYAANVRMNAGTDMMDTICYDNFASASDELMVWYQYPKVGNATYCADGSTTCSDKNKKQQSDIYELFNLIDFTEADYTKSEATMAAKIIAKIETCSTAKLSARKKALWGDFIITTVGNVGQSTNTGAIMQSVQGIAGGGGLSSIGAIASQFLDK